MANETDNEFCGRVGSECNTCVLISEHAFANMLGRSGVDAAKAEQDIALEHTKIPERVSLRKLGHISCESSQRRAWGIGEVRAQAIIDKFSKGTAEEETE